MVTGTSGIFCPHCAHPVRLKSACGTDRLIMAIQLQASRFGAGIVCDACRQGFVYTRYSPTETLSIEDRLTQLQSDGRQRTLLLNPASQGPIRLSNSIASDDAA